MNEKLIKELKRLVENACCDKSNQYGYGIWTHHIKPMMKIGEALAKKYQADEEIVLISILLHDLASIKDHSKADEHHIYGAIEAEEILKGYGYPEDRIESVKKCILNHRAKVNLEKESKEEVCVADSDAIVHIEEISSLFYLAFHEKKLSIDEGSAFIKKKIKGDYEKMSEESKKMYQNKVQVLLDLLGGENG